MNQSKDLTGKLILILVGGHLATAPRPQKEARALRAAGARVLIRGACWNADLAKEDVHLAKDLDVDFSPVVDLRGGGGYSLRLRQRLARELFARFGRVGPRLFGTGAPELLNEARKIDADFTMVHSEGGLWVAKVLLDEGRRVGVDFEDWFSQDLPEAQRRTRPVAALQALERHLLRHSHCCLATTRVMAEALAQDAATSRIPAVVANAFPSGDRIGVMEGVRDPKPVGTISFHWFSQTVGPGRGLETLAQALCRLKGDWQLSLRGSMRHHRDWFEQTFSESLRSHIQVLEPVQNSELLARVMSHDVGLALEEPYCLSRDLTATNKLFEYLRAGLAVIATRTRGQAEIMEACPGVGMLVPPGDPIALANAMQRLIENSTLLETCRRASLDASKGVWDWARQESTLLEAISRGVHA